MDLSWAWNDWLVMAWAAPVALAISGLIDVLMVGDGRFANRFQAASISGLLGVSPFLCVPLVLETDLFASAPAIALAFCAGVLYAVHLLYYFKTLFYANDAAHAEAFIALSVAVVPLFGFVFFDERLPFEACAGIVIASGGVAALVFSGRHKRRKSPTPALLIALVSVSLSLSLEDEAFELCDYATGAFWFALGCTVACGYFALKGGIQRTMVVAAQNKSFLFATNLAALFALGASLRATDISNSVSMVIVIESVTPAFIMMLSGVMLAGSWAIHPLPRAMQTSLREQLVDTPIKIGAISLILIGIILITLRA